MLANHRFNLADSFCLHDRIKRIENHISNGGNSSAYAKQFISLLYENMPVLLHTIGEYEKLNPTLIYR